MEGLKVLRSTQIIILGVCFVIATIVSTVIFSKGLLQIKKFSGEVISVTGSAEKKIESVPQGRGKNRIWKVKEG